MTKVIDMSFKDAEAYLYSTGAWEEGSPGIILIIKSTVILCYIVLFYLASTTFLYNIKIIICILIFYDSGKSICCKCKEQSSYSR